MTKEEMAALLNGRQYRNEITKDECELAKQNNLVVVFGASDDLVEFRGAIYDEEGCYDGGEIYINGGGILPYHETNCECEYCGYEAQLEYAKLLKVIWCEEDGYSWTYEFDLPYATFDIMDDGEKYCRGIVFSMDDI